MKQIISLIFASALALALAHSTLADIEPPIEAPGNSIGPGGHTKVQMLSEQVIMDAQMLKSPGEGYVQVNAEFTMHNQGQAGEQMQVRFPLGSPCDNGFGSPIEVQDFSAGVSGTEAVITTSTDSPDTSQSTSQNCPISWAFFNATFPIDQNVVITVTYHLLPINLGAQAKFGYILETGAGWYGPIHIADFILRLPYPALPDNALGGWAITPRLIGKYLDNEVRWHVDDLEPTTKNNLDFSIIYPIIWQEVVDAQAKLQADPKDFDALMALAQAYRDAADEYHGAVNPHFLDLSIQTYRQALALRADSGEAHAKLARELWEREAIASYPLCPDNPNLPPILQHLSLASSLDPQNETAYDLLAELQDCLHRQIILPTPDPRLLPTPSTTPTITQTPSHTPSPTATLATSITPTFIATFTLSATPASPATTTHTPILTPIVSNSPIPTTTPTQSLLTKGDKNGLLLQIILIVGGALVISFGSWIVYRKSWMSDG